MLIVGQQDARHGVVTQTRRHLTVAALLGVRQVVLAVNKIDLVDYSQDVFEQIREDFTALAQQKTYPSNPTAGAAW